MEPKLGAAASFNARHVAKAAIVAVAAGLAGAAVMGLVATAGFGAAATIAPVGVTVGCVVAALHYWKTQQALISSSNAASARQAFKRIEDGVAETQGLVQLVGAGLPFPLAFGGAYALTADAAAVLAREVAIRRPRLVVELGSGVSTILVGRMLQQMGEGRIVSLDHDAQWAAETRKQVAAAGLERFAEVIDAPLVDHDVGGQRYKWYSLPRGLGEFGAIDLLIVDGPPQRVDPNGLVRYPALPLLAAHLADDAAIFVDDSKRAPETEMVRLWLERFPGWEARWVATVPGTFVLSRRPPAA
jgi:predicted O-methyltransferase YrrM